MWNLAQLLISLVVIATALAVHLGPFQSDSWLPHHESRNLAADRTLLSMPTTASFVVALKHRTPDKMKEEFLAVSTPTNVKYGQHLKVDQIHAKYSPEREDAQAIVSFFEQIDSAVVQLNKVGTMLLVTAPITAIEDYLSTSLAWHVHEDDWAALALSSTTSDISASVPRIKRSLRATSPIQNVPKEIGQFISFISLNTPISHSLAPDLRHARTKSIPKDFSSAAAMPEPMTKYKATSSSEQQQQQQETEESAAAHEASSLSTLEGWRSMLKRMSLAPPFASQQHQHRQLGAGSEAFFEGGDKKTPLGGPGGHVYVTEGNEEVIIRFFPRCADGSLNQMNPPCGATVDHSEYLTRHRRTTTTEEEEENKGFDANRNNNGRGLKMDNSYRSYPTPSPTRPLPAPIFTAVVTQHASDKNDPYLLATEPLNFDLSPKVTFCFNHWTSDLCAGHEGRNCSCFAKLSPLPKYRQLRVVVTSVQPIDEDRNENIRSSSSSPPPHNHNVTEHGHSTLFVLTDVATVSMLTDLYKIPTGLTVRHGSNQSVVEFYNEYYSNSDLMAFLSLTGLKNVSLPQTTAVLGDNGNNQNKPGGEGQLDLEYMMALAPGADTFYYSFSDLNPFNPANEGFLAYLFFVGDQAFPPLVHSLSYGDIEQNVFNASQPGSVDYGRRCDEEFMMMGLRGLTVLIASGDDGIGNLGIRKNQPLACSQAWPDWPASSAYVTAVGATQLSDIYLPACTATYDVSRYLPDEIKLNFQCTGSMEVVCSSVQGGVVTSGGGFSVSNDRETDAPWQAQVVDQYLLQSRFQSEAPTAVLGGTQSYAPFPPDSYFNPKGRGFPDISVYGSNYFVYLDGEVTRESGTSASSPVFAGMVALWNDMRLAYHMPPLGFINPFLYSVYANSPEAFNDVVLGDNACGAGGGLETVNCCDVAFSALPGWDAVTGLGSPNFQIIANLVINNRTFFPNGNDNDNHGDLTTPITTNPTSNDKTNDGTNDPTNHKNPTADATDDTSSNPTTPTGSHDVKPSGPATNDNVTAAMMASTHRMAKIALVLAIGAFILALYSAVILTCRKGQVTSLPAGYGSNDAYGGDNNVNSSSGGSSYQHSRIGGGNGGVRNDDLGFVVTRGTTPGRGGYSAVQMT